MKEAKEGPFSAGPAVVVVVVAVVVVYQSKKTPIQSFQHNHIDC